MRGDSLRDFYAKTLAVVGLGLLAGAGAIVDYWPVGGPIPVVTHVAGLDARTPVRLPAAPDRLPQSMTVLMRASAPRAVARIAAASETWMVMPPASLSLPPAPLPVSLANDLPYGPSVVLTDLEIQDLPALETIRMADLGQTPVLATGDATDDAHGILSEAMRRTRASLRGARWFLGDKIQGVMGAVKKVSPFWDASGSAFAPR